MREIKTANAYIPIARYGSRDLHLYCLNGITGDKLWNCTTGAVYTSPVVVYSPEGGTLALVGADSLIAGLYL